MANDLLTAGVFAQLARTTKRTVTWYDEKGLLNPIHIEPNGYRYYKPSQIIDFQVILLLRKLGFSIEEVKAYLTKNHTLNKLFASQKIIISDQIKHLQQSLTTITQYYANLEENGTLTAPVSKTINSFSIYYIQKEGPYAKIHDYAQELQSYFAKIPQNATYLTLFSEGYQPQKTAMKIGVIMTDAMKLKESSMLIVQSTTIPSFQALTSTHHGSGALLSLLWQELEKYRRRNKCKINKTLPFTGIEFYNRTSLNKPMSEDDMLFTLTLPIHPKRDGLQ
jgi:DNA-binding transcriptional MerR regulator